MRKIPSLFLRNAEFPNLVVDRVAPGCEWVLNDEGVATRKWDGTACLVQNGRLFRRYDAKLPKGSKDWDGRILPMGFMPAQDPDPFTGHWPGWIPVGDGPDDRWHREAIPAGRYDAMEEHYEGRTYELCGPKVNGNPERLIRHVLITHGIHVLPYAPRTYEGLKLFLSTGHMEGIVWHHEDGRMAKIKGKDFWGKGFKRYVPESPAEETGDSGAAEV